MMNRGADDRMNEGERRFRVHDLGAHQRRDCAAGARLIELCEHRHGRQVRSVAQDRERPRHRPRLFGQVPKTQQHRARHTARGPRSATTLT